MTNDQHENTTMKIGMPLPFSDDEYRRRVERSRRAMTEAGLDALLIFHQESMFYLFGYDQLGYWVYQAAILTADSEEISIVIRVADHDLVSNLPGVGEIRAWRDDSADDPVDITVDLLKSLGMTGSGKRVGIELRTHALLPYYSGRLREKLSSVVEVVDASDLVTDLRLVKSAAEIEYTRAAGTYVDAAYKSAFSMLRPGVTEAEVLAAALSGMLLAGGDVPAIVPPLSSGPRAVARTHGAATQRTVQANELLVMEPGGCSHRYHAVGVQSKWLGTVPEPVRGVYDAMVESLQAGFDATKPGAVTADVARAVNGTLDRHGILTPGHHVGYGTGIGYPPTWLDNLRIKETDTHILQPNMVFFLFTHQTVVHESKDVELFIGEPMMVTETGATRLSATPLTLDLP